MPFDAKNFKEYRISLGFTRQNDAKAFLAAKDIIADIDFSYLEKLNERIFEIVSKLNTVIVQDIQHNDIERFKKEIIDTAYKALKDNDIIRRMNNLGRRPEETTFSWLRGHIIAQFFLPGLQHIFKEREIVSIGEDDLEDIEQFKKAPTADFEVNDKKREQKIRLEVQSGFQGVNDIKQHKVLEARRKYAENNVCTIAVHFDIYNGQVAFVRIDSIPDDDLRWITRQQMEGQTVFEIDQNSFLWLLQSTPPKFSDLERELNIDV